GFAPAWRHIVTTFRGEGATNVRWVWCPFAHVGTRRTDEESRRYYPGDRYVDWIGMDGYNRGSARSWSRWRTFGQIFGPLYRDYAGRKPLMICEVASTELGGDKSAWIRDMSAKLGGEFSRVRALVWFDANKETDWRIDSSVASLHAFRSCAGGLAPGWEAITPGRVARRRRTAGGRSRAGDRLSGKASRSAAGGGSTSPGYRRSGGRRRCIETSR